MEWWEKLYNEQFYFELYEKKDTALASKEVSRLIKLLNLKSGARILDVCCGYGRHSLELARRGFNVVGLDISKKQISRAREKAEKAKVKVSFQTGDARKMNFRNEFDAAINMFLSFGYFQTEEEDAAVLKGVFKALKSSGKFLMDFWNREKEIRAFRSREFEKIKNILILKEWNFDHLKGRLNWKNTVTFPDGKKKVFKHSVRTYTVADLKRLMGKAGLKIKAVYGNLAGEEYTINSPAAVITAIKPQK